MLWRISSIAPTKTGRIRALPPGLCTRGLRVQAIRQDQRARSAAIGMIVQCKYDTLPAVEKAIGHAAMG
jgi:hypothetical protein